MARLTGDLVGLNLELARRLQRYADDVGWDLHVTSGHRDISEQAYLYRLWLAGKGNLAAKPVPCGQPGGSFHICRGAGDVKFHNGLRPGDRRELRAKLARHGLSLTVPGEPWHVQCTGWSRAKCNAGPMVVRVSDIRGAQTGATQRPGPTAAEAKILQQQMYDLGFAGTPMARDTWCDGVWGPGSAAALARLQRRYNEVGPDPDIAVDGVPGRQTEAAIGWFYSQAQAAIAAQQAAARAAASGVPRVLRLADPVMRGEDVRELQVKLNRLAWVAPADHLAADGVYGAGTAARVGMAQGGWGIPADQVVGPRTRAALDEALAEQDFAATSPELAENRADPGELVIITRQEWGTAYPQRYAADSLPPAVAVVFHTQGAVDSDGRPVNRDLDHAAFLADVRGDERYHVQDRGYDGGIGYQALISNRGEVAQGRNFRAVAAAARGFNVDRIHVCFRGNGDGQAPTAQAQEAARRLLARLEREGRLAEGWTIAGHRKYSDEGKSCPGTLATDELLAGLRP